MQVIHSPLTFLLWLLIGAAQFFGCGALLVAPPAFSNCYVGEVTDET